VGRRIIPIETTAEEVALHEVRRAIHARAVHGRFAKWRWTMAFATLIGFHGLPWLTIDGRQAVLFDIGVREFDLLGVVFRPQDFIHLAVLLIVAALVLFLFTAIAGRLWCGYACPQTVYTEIFRWIERTIEGDRLARVRLDAAPMSLDKLVVKALKHAAWLTVALWTGYTFVRYFTPIRDLGMRTHHRERSRGGRWGGGRLEAYAPAAHGALRRAVADDDRGCDRLARDAQSAPGGTFSTERGTSIHCTEGRT
jgi:hypothetical protein